MRIKPGNLCHLVCINWGVARAVYLLSGILVVFGFTIEMIMIGLVVAPYLRDAEFTPVSCTFSSSKYSGYVDCQDVNRKPNNNFPCLEVQVTFVANGTSRVLPVVQGKAYIFTVMSYYEDSSSTSPCSSRICYRDSSMNARQIANLNATLYNGNSSYPCYVRQEWSTGRYVALRTHEIAEVKVFHCLLWPSLAFGFGSCLLWITYCCFGCKIWPKEMSL